MYENTGSLKCILIVFVTSLGAFLGRMLGGVDDWMIALLTMIAIDYFTGVAIAIVNKKLSSEIGFKGLVKKVVILMMVAVSVTMDNLMHMNGLLRGAVILFFICNEGISILENAGKLGVPMPAKLKDLFVQLKDDKLNTAVNKILPKK